MSPSTIGAFTLLFMVVSASFGLTIRLTSKWANLESTLATLIKSKDADHILIRQEINILREQLKDDRSSNNQRLVWLEHQPYTGTHRGL